MHMMGLLEKQDVNHRTHYGLSLNRKGHDYPTDVCESYAEILRREHELEEKKREEIKSRGQHGIDEFFS
jgi:hypothetical protein